MQTFVPLSSSYSECARVLDRARLGKQRVECKQIYFALTNPNYGWQNHPAVRMWRGEEYALACYGKAICREWQSRGYKDSLLQYFTDIAVALEPPGHAVKAYPTWWGGPVHLSHRLKLLWKNGNYSQYFNEPIPTTEPEYFWPTSTRFTNPIA